MASHENYHLRIFPHWLLGRTSTDDTDATGWGTRFAAIVGRFFDAAADQDAGSESAALDAGRARFVATAPSDGLPYLAADTRIPRFLAGDTEGELRTRIGDAWGFHDRVGKEAGVDEVMEILGFDPDETFILDRSVAPLWHHDGGFWSQWSVATRNPTGWDLRTDLWNDVFNAETTWADLSGESWDFTCDASTFEQLRSYLWDYRNCHFLPVYVSMTFGDGYSWDDLLARGDTWTETYDSLVDWDDLAGADTSVYVLQVSRLWGHLDLEGGNSEQTWDDLNGSGLRWGRCMTAR